MQNIAVCLLIKNCQIPTSINTQDTCKEAFNKMQHKR